MQFWHEIAFQSGKRYHAVKYRKFGISVFLRVFSRPLLPTNFLTKPKGFRNLVPRVLSPLPGLSLETSNFALSFQIVNRAVMQHQQHY